ncbi:hypothetical protein CP061683_0110B, partial [Chlamydia psittaci 06-1683]
SLAYR